MITIEDNGQNNIISVSDDATADLNRRSIIILGNNNRVDIASGVALNSSLINIVGSDCHLDIEY